MQSLKRKMLGLMCMSTAESINNDDNLRNQILNDLISKSLSLIDLSKKYNIEVVELYSWLKSIEITINQTLSALEGIFPPVDDEEWLNMTKNERLEFFEHLEKGFQFESTSITLDGLKKMRENRKNKT